MQNNQPENGTHTARITAALCRRLTALLTGLTVLVLTLALCVTYSMACAQARAGEEALLSSTFTSLEDKLRYQSIISDTWLSQQEATAHSIIFIEDNDAPLHFAGVWQTDTPRALLVQLAREVPACAGVAAGIPGSRAQSVLTVRRGESYTLRAACIERAAQPQARVTLFLLQDNAVLRRYSQALLWRYAALWLCGVVALWAVSRTLVSLALRPAAAAWQRQTEFIAAAGHELRSPLAVIRASLAAAQPEAMPQQAQSFVRAAERETQRLARLTDDLLLLAAGDAGAWHILPQQLSADTLCIELYERFYALARENGHTLTLQLPDAALPEVLVDAQYFPQMLGILVQNALEHTPAGTEVEIVAKYVAKRAGMANGKRQGPCARRQKGTVAFVIQDHGKGVPDAQKRTVFERFARADKSRTDKNHFGLGLAVVQEIAVLHGACLTLTDTPGGGASFCVTLVQA